MGFFKNIFSLDCKEHLEDFGKETLQGRRLFSITNLDKNLGSHEFFYDHERITINEFNRLLSRHTATSVSLEGCYHSDECITASVEFHDEKGTPSVPAGGAPLAYSRLRSCNVNDLTMEDGYVLDGRKLYCVSAQRKHCGHHELYWNRQCLSIPELNHILASHTAEVEQVIPVYKTGTEWFVLVRFHDTKRTTLHVNFICLTSQRRTPLSRGFFYDYDCITYDEYRQILPSVIQERFRNNGEGAEYGFQTFAATIQGKTIPFHR